MKNKTCGECRYYFEQADFCRLNAWECIEEDEKCCEDFEPPTNGDKIRQMSDEELAEKLVYQLSDGMWVAILVYDGVKFTHRETAIAATIEELKKEYYPADNNVGSITERNGNDRSFGNFGRIGGCDPDCQNDLCF